MTKRLAVVISHAIQHFCPQHASFAARDDLEVRVFFASKVGVEKTFDRNFGRAIQLERLYLDEYPHEFLNEGPIERILPSLDAPNLSERLQAFGPDAVMQFGSGQKFQRRAVAWANANGVPVLHVSDAELHQQRPCWKLLVGQLRLRPFYKKVSAFLTVGDANEAYYRYYGATNRKFFRMSYPIDIRLHDRAFAQREALRDEVCARYDIRSDAIVLSVVGKLIAKKTQNHVIRALHALDGKTDRQIVALIVGSGSMEAAWREEATGMSRNRVVFTGYIPPEELPPMYAATDIYTHVSLREPHSVAISEALYMGCPIILSDRCGSYGPSDDVQLGYNGFVFDHGDIAQLARWIDALAHDDALRARFSDRSAQIARRNQALAHGGALENFFSSRGV